MDRHLLRPFLALCLTALALTSLRAQDNILILVADDFGVDMVGAYAEGNDLPPTPSLDNLATNGVLFRNAWSNPMCSPTRVCMMTGRHAIRTGVGFVVPGNELRDIEVTMPEQLDSRLSGYAHAAIGKWHMNNPTTGATAPNLAGFSHFAGAVTGVSHYSQWLRTVDGVSATSTTYATTQSVDDALAWIQNQNQPWLCYFGLHSVHEPFHAPPSHLHTQDLTGLRPEEHAREHFKAMVEAMDSEIGRLLAGLGPELANTNVIFIGDNGTPGKVAVAPFAAGKGKGSFYEGGVNVPLIVSGPAVNTPGREVDALVSAVDMFSTVMDLAGVVDEPLFASLDSVSFEPYLSDPAQTPLRSTVYSELFADSPLVNFSVIRNDQYKLVEARAGLVVELFFDLDADPFETVDLLTTGNPLTPQEMTNYQALQQAMIDERVIQPGFSEIGPGCPGTTGTPTLRGVGIPRIGETYTIVLENAPPSAACAYFLGGSEFYHRQLPLPFPLSLIGGGPGCNWMVSAEFNFPFATSVNGTLGLNTPVPNERWLVGAEFHHQLLIIDPGAPNNPIGLITSPGLTALVGQ